MKRVLYAAVLTLTVLFLLVIPSASSPPTDILKDALCYGDLSCCLMTTEQAEAFIKTLENSNTKLGQQVDDFFDSYYYSNPRASLCDIDGNGIPALLVYYDTKSDTHGYKDWAGKHYEEIYLWDGNQVNYKGTVVSCAYGSRFSDIQLNFGKNISGSYSWDQFSHYIGTSYHEIFTIKDGTLQKNVCINEHDPETKISTVIYNEEIQGVFDNNPDEANALEQKLLEKAGAPTGDMENHDSIYNMGIPSEDMLSVLKSYIDSAATAVPPEETSETDNTAPPEQTTDAEAMSDTKQKSDEPENDISQSDKSPEPADTSVKDKLPGKYILWISSAAGVIILCTALLLILKKRMTK